MSALENILKGNPDPTQIGKDALLYEGTGRIIGGTLGRTADMIYNGFKERIFPGSVISKLYPLGLRELKPPASGFGSTPFEHPILKGIEDLFGSSTKEQTKTNTSTLGIQKVENILNKITGRSIKLNQGEDLAEQIQRYAFDTFQGYKNVSNLHGAEINNLANLETKQMPIFKAIFPSPAAGQVVQQGQQAMPQLSQVGTYSVSGPIKPSNLMREVNGILNTLEQSHITPDPNNPIIKALLDIKNSFQSVDPQTGETFIRPVWGFADAWATKKHLDELGYEGVNYLNQNIKDVRFQKLSKALSQDIDNSLTDPQLWSPQRGQVARNHWNNVRELVGQRVKIFHPDDETGASLGDLVKKYKPNNEVFGIPLNSVQSPVDDINKYIDDPVKLQRLLLTERRPIYNSIGTQYTFDNRRKDIQGYQLMRIANNALKEDPRNPGNQILDPKKLWSSLNSVDPKIQKSNDILFSKRNRDAIEEFFKNYSIASQDISKEGQRFAALRLGSQGIQLGATLAGALIGNTPSSRVIMGTTGFAGATLGMQHLAKLLANGESAPVIAALAANGPLKMPIGMAGRIIANVLKNTPITFNRSDGTEVRGKFNSKGEFEISLGD